MFRIERMISYLLQDEQPQEDLTEYVIGQQRWKYHKRPLKPMLVENEERFMNEEQYASNEGGELEEFPKLMDQENQLQNMRFKTVGCQTVYRDMDTQTDPFSPQEHIPKDCHPEVMVLKDHVYGAGLPATMEEMYFIEEKREKIMFEGALPPTSDEACFLLRQRLMEDQEMREWKKREVEIKKIHNERLNLLQSALVEREKDTEEYGAKRIEAIRAKKTEGKNRLVAKIQRRKIKILRKILKEKKTIESKKNKKDIVEEYHNFASHKYANITRNGLSLDKLSNKFEVEPYSLQSYEAFEDLISMIKPRYLHSTFNLKEFSKKRQKYTKLQKLHREKLAEAQEEIQRQAREGLCEENENAQQEKKKEYMSRPITPIIDYSRGTDLQHEIRKREENTKNATAAAENTTAALTKEKDPIESLPYEEAVIFFQRLILGRAVQNMMFEGKEKRLALIEELLVVSNIKELDKAKEQELLMEQHQQRVKNAFVEALQGEAISGTFEGLSKELLRFKEEKKIAKFVEQAEKLRREREAEETGRRQAELTLRDREDVLYHEIMKVHQGTVDSCLRKLMARTVDHLATKQAKRMTSLQESKQETKIKDTKRQEVLIKDMVSSLLVPNIERMKVSRRVGLEQQRYNVTVRETLDQAMEKAKEVIVEKNTGKEEMAE